MAQLTLAHFGVQNHREWEQTIRLFEFLFEKGLVTKIEGKNPYTGLREIRYLMREELRPLDYIYFFEKPEDIRWSATEGWIEGRERHTWNATTVSFQGREYGALFEYIVVLGGNMLGFESRWRIVFHKNGGVYFTVTHTKNGKKYKQARAEFEDKFIEHEEARALLK